MKTTLEPKSARTNASPESAKPSAIRHHMRWQLIYEVPALTAVGLILLEMFFSVCGVGLEEILQPDAQLGMHHIPGKRVVWRMEGFSDDKLNSVGMRDAEHTIAKPPGVYRIALLGDSATEGLQVPQDKTYSSALLRLYEAKGIKAEVLNFGCSGYSTGQEVLQYEKEIAQYKPDLTILLYNRGDATENIRKPWDLKVEPRPYFYLDQKGDLQEDYGVVRAHKDAFKPSPVMDFLRKNSCIFGVFSHANLNLLMNEPLYRKVRGWATFMENNRLAKEGKRYCSYMPQDNGKVTNALIERLGVDCRQSGSQLFVVVFPNTNCDPEYASQIPKVESLCKKHGYAYLDLTPLFRWHPDPMSCFVKYHFSIKGHQFVADRMFDTLFPPQKNNIQR